MNNVPPPTRQDLFTTMSALLALQNSHRILAEDREAIRRVIALVALRYFGIDQPHQDLHP